MKELGFSWVKGKMSIIGKSEEVRKYMIIIWNCN